MYEFVSGERLNAALAGQPMNLRRALDLASHLADALADAHALGLVHGALTASGVIVTPKGHAKILDFGLFACLPEGDRGSIEKLDAVDRQAARVEALGRSRVAYAAPEQLLGQAPDHRVDVFALGALLHEMVTGKHAFSGRTALQIGVQVLQLRTPTPSVLEPSVPKSVDRITAKALAKKPGDRYASAALMAADLREAEAAVHSQTPRAEPEARGPRSPWRMAALGILLLALAALGLWQWQEPLVGPGKDGSASRPSRSSSSCRTTLRPPTIRGPTTVRVSPRTWDAGSRTSAASPCSGNRRSARKPASRHKPRLRRLARNWRSRVR